MFRRPPRVNLNAVGAWPEGGVLVGGAARDLLRGVAPKDFDWAVPEPASAARRVAEQVGGHAFPLDEGRDYWRVTAGDIQHDFVPLRADLDTDLRRRDFTVNAIAIRPDGGVTDPLGGVRDLRKKMLQMVGEANLRADPLRLLRAARLSATLGFRIEPQTGATVRRLAAEGLPMPAAERVRDELNTLLMHPDAAKGVLLMHDLGLLRLYLPELEEGIGVTQGGFHHLDVFRHGLEALHQLLARFPDADLALRWAALLHDVGKPRARGVNPNSGRTTFYEHDRIGAALTAHILTRLRLSSAEVERAAALVRAHMAQLPAGEREARRFVHRRRALLPGLLRLMLADREAARGPDSHPAIRHAYTAAVDRVLAALEEQPAAPRPLLTGRDVMALLGFPPGPAVGQALREVAEAQALGEVRTPEEARAFLLARRET